MMRRRVWVGMSLATGLVIAGVAAWVATGGRPVVLVQTLIEEVRPPIVVGLIHSQFGAVASSEKSLLDAEVLALEQINARGGIAGHLVKWEIADGRTDPATFATQARRLIEEKKAVALFGAGTSECRKAVMAIVEEKSNLLVFPGNFEGIERSPRVIYAGGSVNQVVPPAVRWSVDTLKAKRFFVIGTEEIWSRISAEIAKDSVKTASGEITGEIYLPLVGGDVDAVVEAIRKAKPDLVLNLLVSESNKPFYGALRKAGLSPDKLPVIAFNVSEEELREYQVGEMTGQYAACSYFQSLDRPMNREFVRDFKAKFPGEDRVTCDAMVAAYDGVMIWAQAAEEAGTGESGAVLERLDRQSFDAPDGVITIDPESRAAWRPFHVGRVRPDGQFDVVSSITKPVHPLTFLGTRSRTQWQALLEELKTRWGGRWSSMAVPKITGG